MMQMVEQLPDKQQTILRLRHMEGMEMADIAALLCTTETAVRKSLSRARQAVRDMMKNSRK
jgi:RNA polymerase sigma-70 factor (ECF subfamily)